MKLVVIGFATRKTPDKQLWDCHGPRGLNFSGQTLVRKAPESNRLPQAGWAPLGVHESHEKAILPCSPHLEAPSAICMMPGIAETHANGQRSVSPTSNLFILVNPFIPKSKVFFQNASVSFHSCREGEGTPLATWVNSSGTDWRNADGTQDALVAKK